MKRIDCYSHILPKSYFEQLNLLAINKDHLNRWLTIPMLYDLDLRLKMMNQFPEYQQILTLSNPPIEMISGSQESPKLAKIANDSMAEICHKYPHKFPAFVASLPMNNIPEAIIEMERAITKLGARGIQIFTNVNGHALDEPEYWPIFEDAVNKYDVPIWMHPTRGANMPDYAAEKKSKFEIWWTFGWPYETSAAMTRFVFSGFFDKLKNLKIITHHMGGMIPFFDGRIGPGLDQFGSRTTDENYIDLLKSLAKRPIDYFRMFYADTALAGGRSGIRCGLDFFGSKRVLFATDCPFDPEGGNMFLRTIPEAIESLNLPLETKNRIYFENISDLIHLNINCC